MAVINLKVLVDGSAIDAEISKINSAFNKGIKGTSVDNLQKKYANLISTVKNYEKSFPKGTFDKQTESLTRHLNRVKELSQSYERSGKLTKEQQKQYRQLSKDYANISAKVATLRAETEKLEKSNKQSIPSVDNLRKKYANLLNTIQGSEKNYKKGTFSKIAEEAKANLDILKNLDPASADYAKTVNHLDKELNRLSADFAETKSSATNFHGSLKDLVSGFMKFQLAAMLVMKPLQMLKNAYDDLNETLVETEKRVVALRRVAGGAANADELYKLAQKYGQTFENVADSVESFAKAGYDWEESIQAAEAALIAMNVAELDAEQSSEGLIAVMKQFGYEIEDLTYLIDVLNKTADTTAVTTEELLIALQKTGSTAKNANISFEETVGLISALSEGTAASGQNIGNALRSLIVFTSDSKALEKFATLSEDMAKIVDSYKSGQASILDVWQGLGNELNKMGSQKGTLEDLFGGAEMTADIEAQLTQITDSFAEIYGTAGNYRQNYFIALLDNIDKVNEATSNLKDVTGYSQIENLAYLDTYDAKVAKLDAKWKQLANDEQGYLKFKKEMVELAVDLLEVLESIGGLRTVAIALGGAMITILVPALKMTIAKLTEMGFAASKSLGWISAILTLLSAVAGYIEQVNQKAEEGHKATVAAWEATRTQAAELQVLIEKYKELDETSKDYETTEKELETLLGNKIVQLENLKKGTDEYKQALIDLSLVELQRLKDQQEAAKLSAKIQLQNANVGGNVTSSSLSYFLKNIGIKTRDHYVGSATGIPTVGFDINTNKTVEAAIENYNNLLESRKLLLSWYEANPNSDQADAVADLLGEINSEILRVEELINSYNMANESIEEIIKRQKELNGEAEDTVKKIRKDLSELTEKELNDVLNKIEEIRNATRDAYEYEAKKKAVLEAEKALLDAQHNRTVRVLNEATGQWEWVSNAQEVQDAKDNLAEARAAVEDAFFSEVEDSLKTGNVSIASILSIMSRWSSAYGTGNFSEIENVVISAIKELYGIDINAYKPPNDRDNASEIKPNNTTITENPDGSYIITYPDGSKLIDKGDGNPYVEYADGTLEYADGTRILPDGTRILPDGTRILADGTRLSAEAFAFSNAVKEYGNSSLQDYENYLGTFDYEGFLGMLENPAYDSGGVLKGMGGIKATTKDEVVLDPSITKQLLTPVSNQQFDTFVRDLGLLFGMSKSTTNHGAVFAGGMGGSDSHDKHYSINGVPISVADAQRYTIADLCENMSLIPNI